MRKFVRTFLLLALASSFVGCDDESISSPVDKECSSVNKPDGICSCEEGSWICESVDNCEGDSPDDDCKCVKGSWICEDKCPKECPKKCDDNGRCPAVVTCPKECPDDCDENGICNVQITCPDECLNECDENGACIPTKMECPEDCKDDCNDDGSCPVKCPAECKDDCNDDGSCPVKCPAECKDTCDKDGKCPVKCPAECKDTCDKDGKCPFVCPSTCLNGCGKEEKCICAETCRTSCDANGKCKCPSSCEKTCNANGECPGYCGGELVEKIYFTFSEIDMLVPGSKYRTTTSSSVFIKTEKNTYTLETAPCAKDITLTSSKKGVATVEKKLVSGVPKAYFKAVEKGTTTVTATLKNSELKGTTKIHVLDLKNFDQNLAEKIDGKYPHLYRGPIYLGNTYHTQGFDFYDTKTTFYTQRLSTKNVTPDKTTLTGDILSIFGIDKNEKRTGELKLHNAAHGQNLIVENTTKGDYIWLANYGTIKKNSDGGYDLSEKKEHKNTEGYKLGQTITRVKFAEGKSYYPEDISDHYYFSDKEGGSYYYNFEPAIDVKNNRFAFRATYAKNNKVYVKIYNFNSVKKLAQTKVKLPHGIDSFNKNGEFKVNQKPTVMVKDLAELKPSEEFQNGLLVQGLEIENGLVYTATGFGDKLAEKDGKYEYHSYIKLRVLTYKGEVIGDYFLKTKNSKTMDRITTSNGKEKIEKVTYLDNKDLDGMVNDDKIYHIGYFETEGLRVSNGVVYLNMSSMVRNRGDNSTTKRHYTFAVDLKN